MTNHLTRILTALLAIAVGGSVLTMTATPAQAAPVYEVAGHRGATGVTGYPEQSLKAMVYAADHGAPIVEGDVRFTENDYAVMSHNATAPGCTEPISALTFAELRQCASDKVTPQLLFWLRQAKTLGLTALVEIKVPPTEHQVEVFARAVRDEAPADMVVSSFHPVTLADTKAELGSRARYAPIIAPTGSPFGYSVAEHAAQFDLILPDYRWMIVDRMKWYAAAGVDVWLWTANSEDSIIRCKALAKAIPGHSAIIADDVAEVTGL